jgi:hypothetical protein
MPRLLRHHTTVISYLALFLALGGSAAYAQSRWQYTGADIADESLTGDDIQYASLTKNDLAPNSVAASELDVKVEHVSNSEGGWTPEKTVYATCPAGMTVLSGGGSVDGLAGQSSKLTLTSSKPWGTTGWVVKAEKNSYPAQKSSWEHKHTGDSVYDIVWKDWNWYDNHRHTGDWTLSVNAVCAAL